MPLHHFPDYSSHRSIHIHRTFLLTGLLHHPQRSIHCMPVQAHSACLVHVSPYLPKPVWKVYKKSFHRGRTTRLLFHSCLFLPHGSSIPPRTDTRDGIAIRAFYLSRLHYYDYPQGLHPHNSSTSSA